MMITRDNYEPFFLDYLEGNLDKSRMGEFLEFLEMNPDLKEELNLFENTQLPEEEVVFKGKSQLYKRAEEEKSAFEQKSIAWMEGDLGEEERSQFEAYLALHPELKKEQELMLKTRLSPDTRITYPHKQQLYKKTGTLLLMNWVSGVAAAAVVLWGIHSLFEPENQKYIFPEQEVASMIQPMAPEVKSEPKENSEPVEKAGETEMVERAVAAVRTHGNIKSTIKNASPVSVEQKTVPDKREVPVLETIEPLVASLESAPEEGKLALSHRVTIEKINEPQHIMGVEEFLASRVKRAGNGGLLSASRIIQTGLNVASELSGDRIGYKVKNGKIASVDFESKLMAFSIPLQKK